MTATLFLGHVLATKAIECNLEQTYKEKNKGIYTYCNGVASLHKIII